MDFIVATVKIAPFSMIVVIAKTVSFVLIFGVSSIASGTSNSRKKNLKLKKRNGTRLLEKHMTKQKNILLK
jgi:hypothetical protein